MIKNELQILVDILEEAFEEGHNHETYADRVLFAKFLIDHGVLIANVPPHRQDCRTCAQDCQYIGCYMPNIRRCSGYIPAEEGET